jgi:superfamily II DNA/RNA helicase
MKRHVHLGLGFPHGTRRMCFLPDCNGIQKVNQNMVFEGGCASCLTVFLGDVFNMHLFNMHLLACAAHAAPPPRLLQAVSQLFIKATDDEKDAKLYKLFCDMWEGEGKPAPRVIIFANTKRRVDYLSNTFVKEGFTTCAMHGDRKQQERDESLEKFAKGTTNLMFATDVCARGLDIKGVTHVINFDMARDVESYVHRIGRTGRAGEVGESITFWNPDYDKECAPALVKIAEDAGQPVPDWLLLYKKVKAGKQWATSKIPVL